MVSYEYKACLCVWYVCMRWLLAWEEKYPLVEWILKSNNILHTFVRISLTIHSSCCSCHILTDVFEYVCRGIGYKSPLLWALVAKYSRVFCGLVDDVDAAAAFIVVLVDFVVHTYMVILYMPRWWICCLIPAWLVNWWVG